MTNIIDKEELYRIIESKKGLPSKDELYNLFFIAVFEMEEGNSASIMNLLGMKKSDYFYLRNKLMPELKRPHSEKKNRARGGE
jgi:hypothetical protein